MDYAFLFDILLEETVRKRAIFEVTNVLRMESVHTCTLNELKRKS